MFWRENEIVTIGQLVSKRRRLKKFMMTTNDRPKVMAIAQMSLQAKSANNVKEDALKLRAKG